jgi:hypothetical protein
MTDVFEKLRFSEMIEVSERAAAFQMAQLACHPYLSARVLKALGVSMAVRRMF